jgi:hypothetical protein
MLENRFNYDVEYDYDTDYSCSESGCNEEGICRCGHIYRADVTSVDLMKLTHSIYESLVDTTSKSGKRNQKLDSLFGQGEILDKYCIYRILSHYKVYNTDIWEVGVTGGYYGDEIGDVVLSTTTFNHISKDCSQLLSLETLEAKIKFVLTLEYGYLLPELEPVKFEIISISKDDIDFKSLNQNHIKLVNEEKSYNGLIHYSNKSYDLPRGVVRKLGTKYKIIDGFHRIIGYDGSSTFDVFCVKD